jgi:hypothetical protein
MADPIVTMTYDGNDIVPAPTFSYTSSVVYSNDAVVGYNYTITLNGYCIPKGDEDEPNSISNMFTKMLVIKNIFSSNGGTLSIKSDDKPLVYATDIKVISVSFNESSNNWSIFSQYTIQLETNHLHLGTDLSDDPDISEADILSGKDDPNAADNLHSPYLVDMEKYKIKSFNENFNLNVDDNMFNQLSVYVENNPRSGPTTFISNNYYTISLTVSATGKHAVITEDGVKKTLPAWEHAKRFVHTRLCNQINKIASSAGTFADFMKHGSKTQLSNLHNTSAQPSKLIDSVIPTFKIYNETVNCTVSESDGTFEASYNAIVKQQCRLSIIPGVIDIGCTNDALHTITKSVNKTYNANEDTNTTNQEISISVNGEIRGLVPGYNLGADSSAPIKINSSFIGNGSFMTTTPNLVGRIDRTGNAELCFDSIFNYYGFDLKDNFKTALGITHANLQINPATKILPSKMNLTRNYIEGTISYSAEYNNTFNCPTNHYSVDISVEEPIPIIAEFIIPNNNYHTFGSDGIEPSGFPVIQNLGTNTAKKINVTINGNVGEDFNKCCLGSDQDTTWNLLNYDVFSLGAFTLPSGLILPVISSGYVLTSKTKKTTYPQGNFTISLAYTCATTCPLNYLSDKVECPAR